MNKKILIKEYQYNLPEEHIAKFPLDNREDSKLLVYKNGNISEDIFKNLCNQFPEPVLFVRNNTRVISARLIFFTASNQRIEIFLLEPFEQSIEQALQNDSGVIQFCCLIGNKGKWKEGELILKNNDLKLTAWFINQIANEFIVELRWKKGISFLWVIEQFGHTPLPPYLNREDELNDKSSYQTVYSTTDGSVAAPTAGLHFTSQLIEELKSKHHQFADVTLHVGAGTFKSVQTEDATEHEMHAEEIFISLQSLQTIYDAIKFKIKIVAVGTTSCRTLETLYGWGLQLQQQKEKKDDYFFLNQWEIYNAIAISPGECIELLIEFMKKNNFTSIRGKTQLMITPSFKFRMIDALITNFHQPGSTLLLLVAALIGKDWEKVYSYAIENNFRFLSYGDTSLLWRKK